MSKGFFRFFMLAGILITITQSTFADSLTLVLSVFSGLPDPELIITDSAASNPIKTRMNYYSEVVTTKTQFVQSCPDISIAGYRGIFINGSIFVGMGAVQILDMTSPGYNRCFPDPDREFEKLLCRAIAREYPDMAQLIPDSLLQPQLKYGVLTIITGAIDSFSIDFSQLPTQNAQAGMIPDTGFAIPDITIVPTGRYSAIEEITGSSKQIFTELLSIQPIPQEFNPDSLYLHFSVNSRIPDMDFTIQTQEGATIYLYPLDYYIGAYNRNTYFYRYSTGSEPYSIAGIRYPLTKVNAKPSIILLHDGPIDLKGRIMKNGGSDLKLPSSVYVTKVHDEQKSKRKIKVK